MQLLGLRYHLLRWGRGEKEQTFCGEGEELGGHPGVPDMCS